MLLQRLQAGVHLLAAALLVAAPLALATPVTLQCKGTRLDRHLLKETVLDMPRTVIVDVGERRMLVKEGDATLAGEISSITPSFVFGVLSYQGTPPVVNGKSVVFENLMIDRWTGAAAGSRHPPSGEDLGQYKGVCVPPGREPVFDFTEAMKKGTLVPEGTPLF